MIDCEIAATVEPKERKPVRDSKIRRRAREIARKRYPGMDWDLVAVPKWQPQRKHLTKVQQQECLGQAREDYGAPLRFL
jgi:hypothetical protein